MEKQNLTQQKHAFANQNKCTTTQNRHKRLKPGLVASDGIQPGNGEDLFRFRHFINLSLTYLLRHLPTYLQPRTHAGHFPGKTGLPGSLCFFICSTRQPLVTRGTNSRAGCPSGHPTMPSTEGNTTPTTGLMSSFLHPSPDS